MGEGANMVEKLERQRQSLIQYLRAKLEAEDWHACQDAASDIREIEAQFILLRKIAAGPPA
jgi:hypothetical protein